MSTELERQKSEPSSLAVSPAPNEAELAPSIARRPSRRWRDNANKILTLIRDTHPPPEQQALRLRTVERNIILPVKALLVVLVAFFVFAPVTTNESSQGRLAARRLRGVPTVPRRPLTPPSTEQITTQASTGIVHQTSTNAAPPPAPTNAPRHLDDPNAGGTSLSSTSMVVDLTQPRIADRLNAGNDAFNEGYRALRWMLVVYILINIPVAVLLLKPKALRLRLRHIQNVIFFISTLDALFVASLTYLTEGFASIVFWLFPGLILRNSISLPLARPQLLLNLITVMFYTLAGVLDVSTNYGPADWSEVGFPDSIFNHPTSQSNTEPFLLRIVLLLLLTFCCYGLQVLLEKQRQTEEDARELSSRQQQLDVAARLAAQIAHQIKNPLGIINTTVFNLERSLRTGKQEAAENQLNMIREEIQRADSVITRLMGYAQLKEGRVEKLDVVEEIERVLHEVFPPVAKYSTRIICEFAPDLPSLWMQRQHLGDIFSNILLNAREALFGEGEIRISAQPEPKGGVRVVFADNGPGIPPERINQVFHPYFTTKEKGSGLGLAIVKQNMNLYGGSVAIESEVGKGARFILTFPTRAITKWTP